MMELATMPIRTMMEIMYLLLMSSLGFPYFLTDTDGDGIGDANDPTPLNPGASGDTDGDGLIVRW